MGKASSRGLARAGCAMGQLVHAAQVLVGFPGIATCPGLAQAARALPGLIPFSSGSSWLPCLLAHACELPGREDCPARSTILPSLAWPPGPGFCRGGSTTARLPPRTRFNFVSPSAQHPDPCQKPLLLAGAAAAPASGWLCLCLMRGQAIQRMEAKTGVALVRRAAPAFLWFGQSGRHLSMRRRQG